MFDFLLKNESCQNYVLTIPLCIGGRDEATGENGIEIGRQAAHAHQRATHKPRVFFARMADLTRIPDDPTHKLTRIRMTSS